MGDDVISDEEDEEENEKKDAKDTQNDVPDADCPCEALRASAVGWLKEELINAHRRSSSHNSGSTGATHPREHGDRPEMTGMHLQLQPPLAH